MACFGVGNQFSKLDLVYLLYLKTELHKADKRGKGDYGWLTTRYSFSFADWYDPSKMGFGKLRVLNDDVIAAGAGFGKHGHRDMEIITVVTKGAVHHEDSMGNSGVVKAGEVQVMSAGSGVMHSEQNNSETESLELFQLWVESSARGITPYYNQQSFDFLSVTNGFMELVGDSSLTINQDATISYDAIDSGVSRTYNLKNKKTECTFLLLRVALLLAMLFFKKGMLYVSQMLRKLK
jgi:hypothetical protein